MRAFLDVSPEVIIFLHRVDVIIFILTYILFCLITIIMGSSEEILLFMIEQENYESLKLLIEAGIDLNYRNAEGFTPLLCAIEKGNYRIVKLLLEHGAESNYMGKLQNENSTPGDHDLVEWTPLFHAVLYDHSDIVELLIEHGAHVTFTDEFGRSALSTAMQRGHQKCLNVLLKYSGSNPMGNAIPEAFIGIKMKKLLRDQRAKEHEQRMQKNEVLPQLHHAAQMDDRNALRELIKKGANLNVQDRKGNCALHVAMENGHVNSAELLIKRGANINMEGNNGNTVLHIAASLGLASVIPMLIQNGALVDSKNRDDLTPLSFAVFHSHPVCVKQLLNHGANVNGTFDDGKTALHIAVSKSHVCIDILLKEKADVFAKDDEGTCPLELAVDQGLSVFKKLFPGKYNVAGPDGDTPLHYAARSSRRDTLDFLIKGGCDINAQDKNGDTPLHFACMFDQLAYAARSFFEGIPRRDYPSNNVQLLLQAGADIAKKNKNGLAPIHICAQQGTLIAMKVLMDNGCDLNLQGGRRKQTPLHIASERGALPCLEFLLSNGADKNAVDIDKCTPLMLTAKNAHFQCVRLLLEYNALLWAS